MGIFLHPSLLFFLWSSRVLQSTTLSKNLHNEKGNCILASESSSTPPPPLLTVQKITFCFGSYSTFSGGEYSVTVQAA